MKFNFNLPESSNPSKKAKLIIVCFSFLFFAVNLFFLSQEFYLFSLFPIVLLLIFLYFVSIDLMFFVSVFLTPLSIPLIDQNFNLGIIVPIEPLLFGLMLIFFFKLLIDNPLSKKFVIHPVTIFILLQMFWMLITVFVSQMPVVSIKYFVMQLWFVVPMYFLGSTILTDKNKYYKFFTLIIISTCLIVLYTTIRHSTFGFERAVGNWMMDPFFNDHTHYGSVLALLLPVVVFLTFKSSFSFKHKVFFLIATLIILTGIYMSHSRATWMSIAISAGFALVLFLKIKLRYVIVAAVFAGAIFYANLDNIIMKLEKNRQDSSAKFVEHVQSMTNISTDASNLERINRWKAAFRMFQDNPIFGVGPGTYQFLYAPFQKAKDKTIISTNAGDLGNAHSEYFTPLSERGVLGLVFFLGIIFSVFYIGVNSYNKIKSKEDKLIIAALLIGLVSYLSHGFMNNFLDTPTASIIFWGYIVIIVNYSLKYQKVEKNTNAELNT